MFQTANSSLLVSEVVAVVTVVTAGPPAVSAQPPKLYPVLVVVETLVRASVVKFRESGETLVEVVFAGTVEAKVFPLKEIVGFSAVTALAGAPNENTPETARIRVARTAIGFLVVRSDIWGPLWFVAVLTPC